MQTNEFIQKPVRQLFLHYLIPAICGTMVTSIYVLADTIIIGKRGWSFAEISPIRDVFVESYRELFHDELKIEAIHAGLECGLFSDAIPGLDAIAVGPTIRGCHTPDEHLPLDSFAHFYALLTDVLKRLA